MELRRRSVEGHAGAGRCAAIGLLRCERIGAGARGRIDLGRTALQAFTIKPCARRDVDIELAARSAQRCMGARRYADVHVLQGQVRAIEARTGGHIKRAIGGRHHCHAVFRTAAAEQLHLAADVQRVALHLDDQVVEVLAALDLALHVERTLADDGFDAGRHVNACEVGVRAAQGFLVGLAAGHADNAAGEGSSKKSGEDDQTAVHGVCPCYVFAFFSQPRRAGHCASDPSSAATP